MEVIRLHIVPENSVKTRLSDYGVTAFDGLYSKSAIKKMIARKEIRLNGVEGNTGDWINPGDKIELLSSTHTIRPIDLNLEVIFEDEHLAIVNKPAGIPVSGNQHRTIQNALINKLKPSGAKGALKIPRPAHRLDALTSGILVIGKTTKTLLELNKLFEQKQVKKKYRALIMGRLEGEGEITEFIDEKPATTLYKSMQLVPSAKVDYISLVELTPLTGRTHQIRKHLAGLEHPIVGDHIYTKDRPLLKGKGLFLCANEIEFDHPVSQESMKFKIALPSKFRRRMEYEQKRWNKFN